MRQPDAEGIVRMLRNRITGAAGVFVVAFSAAQAATLIPVVPVPGSAHTLIIDISDDNIITGSYLNSDGSEHGFFGTLDGQYTTFDFDNVNYPGTQAKFISKKGIITGIANLSQEASLLDLRQFERSANGTMKLVTDHGTPTAGNMGGVNSDGTIVGENFHEDGSADGYFGKKAKVKGLVDLGMTARRVRPRGLNDAGDMVGYFTNTNSSGFMIHKGTVSVIDYPDANSRNTVLEGVNGKRVVAGYWEDNNAFQSAFYLDTKKGNFTPINVQSDGGTEAIGINGAGLIALQIYDADFNTTSFVYCPKKKSRCPAGGTEIPDAHPIHVPAGSFLLRHKQAGVLGRSNSQAPYEDGVKRRSASH